MSRRGSAVLGVLLALSAPAPALAQSVGDEQYRDPFAGQDESPPADGDQGGPAPAPAPVPAPTTTAAPTETAAGEPIATTADTLPRTGTEPAWVLAVGLLLVAAGAAVRRTAPA